MAADQPVIVVLCVQDPGQDELMLIGETGAARGLFPTLLKAGIRIPINRAMMAMTTNSSISVKAYLVFITAARHKY